MLRVTIPSTAGVVINEAAFDAQRRGVHERIANDEYHDPDRDENNGCYWVCLHIAPFGINYPDCFFSQVTKLCVPE